MEILTTWTLTDIAALESAIKSGALEVWYGDKRVKYRSIAEMQQILQQIKDALQPDRKATRRHYGDFKNGF